MISHEFAGRVALVTGAASGIGKAVAEWLALRGMGEMVLVDRDADGLAALDLPGNIRRVAGDVSDPALWDKIEFAETRLDHALINAGVADGCPIVDLDFAEWRRIMSVNLDGAFLSLRAALRIMARAEPIGDAREQRSVVLTSSVAGVRPLPFTAAYGSSKAAIAHLARIAASEQAGHGIRVNAVAPGRVDTPIWTRTAQFQALKAELGNREEALTQLAEQTTPLGRFASAEEMAGQIGFLLSDAARNITGTVLVSDGGYSL